MDKCYECGKKFEWDELESYSDNGSDIELYCRECAGFPNHEYKVTCPNCKIEILVN